MFGRKKIKELELRISKLEFINSNPAFYKVGDKLKHLPHVVIIGVTCEPNYLHGFYGERYQFGWYWRYEGFDNKNNTKTNVG